MSSLQLKVFYGDGDKCKAIFTTPSVLQTYENLVDVIKNHIKALEFLGETELKILYQDDEETFVELEGSRDHLAEALRCAVEVQGSGFRRLKLKVFGSTTPKQPSKQRRIDRSETHLENDTPCTAYLKRPDTSVKKKLPFTSDQEFNSPLTLSEQVSSFKSPLEQYIEDKVQEIEDAEADVNSLVTEVAKFKASVPCVDKSRSACGLCHRRENHNRTNCPYVPYKCMSATVCGDLEKHKEEKDVIKKMEGKLNSEKQKVIKLKSTLAAKKACALEATHSFNAVVRRRLIESFPAKYLRGDGKENWRQVNMDMAILESHFKGNIPPDEIDLQEVLQNKVPAFQSHLPVDDRVRNLWTLKGLKWPEFGQCHNPSKSNSSVPVCSEMGSDKDSATILSLAPTQREEEEEQLGIAIRESLRFVSATDNTPKQVFDEESEISTTDNVNVDDVDAASMLLNLMRSKN